MNVSGRKSQGPGITLRRLEYRLTAVFISETVLIVRSDHPRVIENREAACQKQVYSYQHCKVLDSAVFELADIETVLVFVPSSRLHRLYKNHVMHLKHP
jgi:hypothetical protein